MKIKSAALFAICVLTLTVPALCAAAADDDFISEGRFVYRVLACGEGDVPSGIHAADVNGHCAKMKPDIDRYKKEFADKAGTFIATLRPGGLPSSVVYPFGGDDLVTALAAYPDWDDYTTISLESAGDSVRITRADRKSLKAALANYRSVLGFHLRTNDSSNVNARALEGGMVPSQVAFALSALVIFGYEPVSLKFFTINPDGSLHYFTRKEIASLEKVKGQKLYKTWVDTDFSVAYRNMELTFKKKGADGSRILVHRHIAANLDNKNFVNSPLQIFLRKKGKISAITKAASYLMWMDSFTGIRDYLLENLSFMVADSTGILPWQAEAAGFETVTYGKFNGAFLKDNGGKDAERLKKIWQSQPYRPLGFRFGYSDIKGSSHMLIMRPKTKSAPANPTSRPEK